jgi:hypothetical protein
MTLRWIIEDMNWAIVLIAVSASILTLFLSKPKKTWLAIVTAILILISGTYNAYDLNQKRKAHQQLEKHIYSQLSTITAQILGIVGDMVFFASDGWLPNSENDFFSLRTATIICNHLDLDSKAPVMPEVTWRNLIYNQAKKNRTELEQIIKDYSNDLDSNLINIISRVSNTNFLKAFPGLCSPDSKLLYERYAEKKLENNLLCYGFEKDVANDLLLFRELYKNVCENDKRYGISWPFKFLKRWKKERVGEDRTEAIPRSSYSISP